ncbi:MAG: DUF3488 and transglutaminase-like domain-containing protein [Thermodesulfovibrionales bacterium]
MPIQYKLITAVLSLTGCVSLLITAELNPVMTVSGLAIIPGYYRFLRGRPHAPRWATGSLTTLALLVFLADAFVITSDIFLAVAHLTITFHGLKSFDLKEPWDHLQVYFMSLLQLIIASELTRSLAFGVVFIVFLVLLVTAMVFSHFLKERALGSVPIRRPLAVISLLTLVVTVIVFVGLPRTPLRFIGKSHARGIKTVGFSDRVDLGSFGEVKLDPTVVMRVVMQDQAGMPLYWRGLTMDAFDGVSWRSTGTDRMRVSKTAEEFLFSPYAAGEAVEQRIFLEPLDSDVLFGLPRIAAIRADSNSLIVAAGMSVVMPGKGARRVSYTVLSDTGGAYPGSPEDRYLQMPSGTGRIADLASRIAAGAATDRDRCRLIEDHLRRSYRYSLETQPPPPGTSAIDDFLFRSRQGYCEHYATAMVLMLRSLRIPARIVNGFYGGERNEFGDYLLVRQSNAHSWVEALVNGSWIRFDPTPEVSVARPPAIEMFLDSLTMRWSRYVVGFSRQDQKAIVQAVFFLFDRRQWERPGREQLAGLLVAAAAIGVMALLVFYRNLSLPERRMTPETRAYLRLRRAMGRRGFRSKPSSTPADLREFGASLGKAEAVNEFLDLYEQARFGGREMGPAEKKRFNELFRQASKAALEELKRSRGKMFLDNSRKLE